MRRTTPTLLTLSGSLLLLLASACGGADAPPPQPPPPPPPPVAATTPPATTDAPVAPPPSPEDEKKAKALAELHKDMDKWHSDNLAELARWTPDVHAAAGKLASATYPTLKAAMTAVAAGPQRKPGDAGRDKFRHPLETLGFFGLKPNMTVLEIGPGEGWYTELLAPTLAAKGKLIDTSGDPNGPPDTRGTFYAQRWQAFLGKAPEVFGKVQTVVVDGKAPSLASIPAGSVDQVVVMREVHGMVNGNTLNTWLTEIHNVLKTGGVLGIEEHRAKPDADPVASSKNGYVPEPWLIDQVKAAGFKLAGKSEINANAKDTKDYPDGVWDLPPTYEAGDKDHDKYAAIGESDRMTLKFTKAAEAPAPAAKK